MRISLLLAMCLLLISIGLTSSANAIKINITYPSDGAILQQTENGDINVRGTYDEDIPPGQYLWIFVYHVTNGKYHPQPMPNLEYNYWNTQAIIGKDKGQFDIIATLANQGENNNLVDYLTENPRVSLGPGLGSIPNGINIYKMIQIIWD